MFRAARRPAGVWRHVCLTLATLAIALKVLAPPGFMPGAPGDVPAFTLVLCTGQGAVSVDPGHAAPAPGDLDDAPGGAAHDAPCAFAGHGLNAPTPNLLDAGAGASVAYHAPGPVAFLGLAPGRGLTGPPLPARGPPTLLI